MVGLRYGSDEAAKATEGWMHLIAREAYLASVELAKEKGPFPLFDAEAYLASGNLMQMDEDVRAAIREHGIRNALLTSVAPTGTISLYAGNVSSGIEPVFAYAYTRKVLQTDGTRTEEEVVDYAVRLWREKFGDAKEAPARAGRPNQERAAQVGKPLRYEDCAGSAFLNRCGLLRPFGKTEVGATRQFQGVDPVNQPRRVGRLGKDRVW
jgi:hypothetical protein